MLLRAKVHGLDLCTDHLSHLMLLRMQRSTAGALAPSNSERGLQEPPASEEMCHGPAVFRTARQIAPRSLARVE